PGFVENFAEAEEIGLRRTWSFRRNKPLGAYVRAGLMHVRDQADVRQFSRPVDEDDVGRLDVAMHQAALMKFGQRVAQGDAELEALLQGERATTRNLSGQSARRIFFGIAALAGDLVVTQLHNVIE